MGGLTEMRTIAEEVESLVGQFRELHDLANQLSKEFSNSEEVILEKALNLQILLVELGETMAEFNERLTKALDKYRSFQGLTSWQIQNST